MSKQVSAAELAAIVTQLLTDPDGAGNLSDLETYQGFMTDIAKVVTDYCGGEVRRTADSVEDVFYVGIFGNDSLPSDGGIWANVDPEGELFPKDESEVQSDMEESAAALGFTSVAAMEQHQDWMNTRDAEHASALAYQGTDEARGRAETASKEFGIPLETIIFVEPPADNGPVD